MVTTSGNAGLSYVARGTVYVYSLIDIFPDMVYNDRLVNLWCLLAMSSKVLFASSGAFSSGSYGCPLDANITWGACNDGYPASAVLVIPLRDRFHELSVTPGGTFSLQTSVTSVIVYNNALLSAVGRLPIFSTVLFVCHYGV